MVQQDTLPTIRPPADQTTATVWCDRFDRKEASPLGIRRVLTQVCHDLYGTKDVQNVITATYVWMADQIGHLTLGLVPTLLLCWLVTLLLPQNTGFASALRILLNVAAAAGVFAIWAVKERQGARWRWESRRPHRPGRSRCRRCGRHADSRWRPPLRSGRRDMPRRMPRPD